MSERSLPVCARPVVEARLKPEALSQETEQLVVPDAIETQSVRKSLFVLLCRKSLLVVTARSKQNPPGGRGYDFSWKTSPRSPLQRV